MFYKNLSTYKLIVKNKKGNVALIFGANSIQLRKNNIDSLWLHLQYKK